LAEVVEGDEGPELFLRAVVASVDGSVTLRRSIVGGVDDAERLGKDLAAELLDDGAADLMPPRDPRPPDPAAVTIPSTTRTTISTGEGDL
jgi:hydroxymethylbilane synthase